MGGTQLLFLNDDLNVVVIGQCSFRDLVSSVARDHDNSVGFQNGTGAHSVYQHGRARDRVQHLWKVGIHPRALSGGKDDQRCGHLISLFICSRSFYRG